MKLEKVNMTPGEKAMALEKGEVFYSQDGSISYRYDADITGSFVSNLGKEWCGINCEWGFQWYRKAKTFKCNGFELIDDRYEPDQLTDHLPGSVWVVECTAYIVLSSSYIGELEELVMDYIKDGWLAQGGVSAVAVNTRSRVEYLQSMIKP